MTCSYIRDHIQMNLLVKYDLVIPQSICDYFTECLMVCQPSTQKVASPTPSKNYTARRKSLYRSSSKIQKGKRFQPLVATVVFLTLEKDNKPRTAFILTYAFSQKQIEKVAEIENGFFFCFLFFVFCFFSAHSFFFFFFILF